MLSEYEITDEPIIEDRSIEQLPDQVRERHTR